MEFLGRRRLRGIHWVIKFVEFQIKSIKSEIELQQHDLTSSKQPILGIAPVSSKQLDFKKIKLHLINANVKTKLLLLQALRWVK